MPSKPGVYLFLGSENEVLYIGKAKNLKKRVGSYFINKANLLEKTKILVSQIKKIRYIVAESEIEALLLEANYIKKHMPKYNARLRDGKRYPLIRITVRDKYPKVLIAKRYEDDPSDKRSLYFGPFPNSSAVHLVLRTIRRIFPFQSVANHPKRLCLYNHLGLCPCPPMFDKDTPNTRSILAKEYRKSIYHIIDFLKGCTKKVLKNLEGEREILSKIENFEKASEIQKKIDSIKYVTSPFYQKFDYRIDPNLDEDLRNKELKMLKECLEKHKVRIESLKRIECFDISNISGTSATGSMVVFINGEKDPSKYRRFKIKNVNKAPNDFTMMQEVLQRRIKHIEWPYPDLVVVDGGKGQVSVALNVLKIQNIKIPVIGLAKREETIVIPYEEKEHFSEVYLPKDSPALHLIMRIRDEAHRFAIKYHRLLRSKELTS